MSLGKYKSKRDFSRSPEPEGSIKKNTPSLSFVVQRHKASHLHYDLRLEMDGVLKSWAVPKGPSMNPKHKRLAMMVEDHPYAYKDFKGIIPSGYGAGIVEIWDYGKYTDIDNSKKDDAEKILKAGLRSGSLKFTLYGKKLKGEFALVKLKGRQENAWLLIKHNDQYAVDTDYNSENETPSSSPINKWLAENAKPKKKTSVVSRGQPAQKLPHFIKPMLAKETDQAFDGADWLFEIKWDGYRAVCEIKDGEVKLYSRNGIIFNNKYPLVANALKKIKHDAVLDGEIVVLNEKGKPDFQKLQHYEEHTQYPICYYVFDLLSLDGNDTCALPLTDRKKLLKRLIKKDAVIRYSDHITGKGRAFFRAAARQNLEGIMAKKADSAYHKGIRTPDWLKIKHHTSEEVIIAGFTRSTGSGKYFGALVLAVKSENGLKYAGHTGSGFTDNELREIYNKLIPLKTDTSPFKEKVKTNMPVTWVKPAYVCEVKFTEWTNDGKMRHPVFLRMPDDKFIKDTSMNKTKTTVPAKTQKKAALNKDTGNELRIGSIQVKITNRDKLYWPEDGITKGMMIDYYQTMAPYILPYLKGRPESLKRNPNGISDKGFYHKDAGDGAPAFVKSISLYSESSKKDIDYIICNDKATLAYLNNLGCIELNPWNSTTRSLDKPDYMIIDIDPSSKNNFEQVIETALAFKQVLDKAGASSFCKTSGATGLHIYVPMGRRYLYEQVRGFAEIVCNMVHEQLPAFTSVERNLKKRGNKIYLDYLQNSRGQTIAAAYSLRPQPGATVSTPVLWEELKAGFHPSLFTIQSVPERVKKMKDIFRPVLGKGIDLKKCLSQLSAFLIINIILNFTLNS